MGAMLQHLELERMENCEKKHTSLTSSLMCVISLPDSLCFPTLPLSGAIISYSETRPEVFQCDTLKSALCFGIAEGRNTLVFEKKLFSIQGLAFQGQPARNPAELFKFTH